MRDHNYGIYADKVEMRCRGASSGYRTKAVIDGVGPGARLEAFRGATLVCPFREGEAVLDTYYGVKLEATLIAGLAGGLFYNSRQSCILAGANLAGLGISLTGAKLTIEKAYR